MITQGEGIGGPFRVMPWQRKLLRLFDRPGDIGLSMGRGGAKTTTLAGVAAAAVDPDGPLSQPRGEVVIVASSFGQARIDFEHVLAFLRPKIDADPRAWRIRDAGLAANERVRRPFTTAFYHRHRRAAAMSASIALATRRPSP